MVDIYENELTDKIERELWFDRETELLDRPNGPADITFYEWRGRDCRSETHYKQGSIFRADDLPSIVVVDIETQVETLQKWNVDGATTRSGDKPAVIVTDAETGVVVREEYWKDGLRHRSHGAAYIERDRIHGHVTRESFYEHGNEIETPDSPQPNLP